MIPVPESEAETLPPGLAEAFRLVCLLPPLVGSKVTSMTQLLPLARGAPDTQFVPPVTTNCVASPPLGPNERLPLGAVPSFVTVNVWIPLPPFTAMLL